MSGQLFAIGHSTRPFEKFLQILKAHDVTLLTDIRTIPRSGHNPQFAHETLSKELAAQGIRYVHLKELGGLRQPKPDSVNSGWENKNFRGYADYMQTDEFEKALETLLELSQNETVAFMCAEGNPFRCHRSLVADALTARGISAYHIASARSRKLHRLTPFAVVKDEKVTYPGPPR